MIAIDSSSIADLRLLAKLDTPATRATMPYGIVVFAVLDALPALVVLAALAAQLYWISLAQTSAMLQGSGSRNGMHAQA